MMDSPEAAVTRLPSKSDRAEIANLPFDLVDAKTVERAIRGRNANESFEYVVTPNVDHVVRCHRSGLHHLYENAWLSVCDSRILAKLSRLVKVRFPAVITGSDLTRQILDHYLVPGDHITVIGCDSANVAKLEASLDGISVHHYDPPMGFIKAQSEVERAVAFVLAHPSRFVFLAVGSPQQETLAMKIKENGGKGTGLCIGASILFVVGAERRAPQWVQAINLEWLYRLIQNPKRLWRRYLIDDPLVFGLILRQRFFSQSKKNVQS